MTPTDDLAARSTGVSSDATGGTEDTPPRGAVALRPCRWCAIPTDPRELDHRDVCIPCDDEWHQARADEQAELEKLS